MKKYGALLLLIPILCSCAYIGSKSISNSLSQQEQICSELKRNIIFDTASTPGTGSASSTQYAEMMRLYSKNGCDKLEK